MVLWVPYRVSAISGESHLDIFMYVFTYTSKPLNKVLKQYMF